MISLVFRCFTREGLPAVQIEALQRDIWKKCAKRGLGGYFINDEGSLLGHFEGEEKAVFGCIETMIRKSAITSIVVISEEDAADQGAGMWAHKAYRREDLPGQALAGLTKLALSEPGPVEPARLKSVSTEV